MLCRPRKHLAAGGRRGAANRAGPRGNAECRRVYSHQGTQPRLTARGSDCSDLRSKQPGRPRILNLPTGPELEGGWCERRCRVSRLTTRRAGRYRAALSPVCREGLAPRAARSRASDNQVASRPRGAGLWDVQGIPTTGQILPCPPQPLMLDDACRICEGNHLVPLAQWVRGTEHVRPS